MPTLTAQQAGSGQKVKLHGNAFAPGRVVIAANKDGGPGEVLKVAANDAGQFDREEQLDPGSWSFNATDSKGGTHSATLSVT